MPDAPRRGSLLVIFLTVFIDLLGFGLVLPLLPIYADQFATDSRGIQLGILMASFSAMQFLFAPMWGRLSDRIGRRPVIMIGLFGSVVFYTMFSIATIQESMFFLFVSRFGAGIAGATVSTAQAYIADTTTLEKRPKGMALIGMAFGLGFTFGPLIGYLAVPTGEGNPGPWPGYSAASLSACALLLAWFKLPESLSANSETAARNTFDLQSWREALGMASIVPLLLTTFVCVFSFANFEVSLSLLLKGEQKTDLPSVFQFTHGQVCLSFAYIGFVLALVQGGLVRRIAGKVPEAALAAFGAIFEIVGFGVVVLSIRIESSLVLFVGLTAIVSGFAFLTPSLNSLLSRRTSPSNQGRILGVAQSANSLARILGSGIGIPLLKQSMSLPFVTAAGLMSVGTLLVVWASRKGQDYVEE